MTVPDLTRAKWNVGAAAAILVLLVYLGVILHGVFTGATSDKDALKQLQDAASYVFVYLWGQASRGAAS